LELIEQIEPARVINCTGPNLNYRKVGSPLLNSLFTQGLSTPGPLGTALATDGNGALKATNGTYSRVLFHVGPGRQGNLLEAIAVPELREQAAALAVFLAGQFDREQYAA
jgi:hydroxyacylglutathione hydrolase